MCEMTLQCKIIVDSVNQNHTINDVSGQVIVTARNAATANGLGLLLEGRATSTLISKQQSLLKVRRSCYYFILKPYVCSNGRFEPVGNYDETSSDDQVIEWICKKIKLQPGLNIFPFSISLNQQQVLPTAFKHELGSIQYRIAVYLNKKQESKFSRVTESNIDILNHSHSQILHISNPVTVTKYRNGLGGKLVEGKLSLKSCIFVPGKEIEFMLIVNNENAGRVQSISVNLVRNLVFYAASFSKSELTVLGTKEMHDCSLLAQNTLEWEGYLKIPSGSMLSFKTGQKCLEVFYFVQFTVTLVGNGVVQGEIPVQVVSSLRNLPAEGTQLDSTESNAETRTGKNSPPPPSYWETMRQSATLETLPPAYEDL